MRIGTPGFVRVNQAQMPVGSIRGAKIGIVLETHKPTSNQPRFYNGYTADVLLLDDMHEIRDVLIPVLFGGAVSMATYSIDTTDSEYVNRLRKGETLPHPSTSDSATMAKWGAWVLVDVLDCGLAWICGYLPHPARPIEHLPQQEEAGARMTDVALQSTMGGVSTGTTWAYSEPDGTDDVA